MTNTAHKTQTFQAFSYQCSLHLNLTANVDRQLTIEPNNIKLNRTQRIITSMYNSEITQSQNESNILKKSTHIQVPGTMSSRTETNSSH